MQTLLALCLAFSAVSLILTFVTHFAVWRVRGRKPRTGACPPISVRKPLKGVDDELYANLVSFAEQDYPEFELILGCEDPADPALAYAYRLKRDFPDVQIRVLAGAVERGLNPKVNNLHMLSAGARYERLLVSDASVRARPDYLAAMARELGEPGVGLVSSVIVGSGEADFGARLDNLHMNSFVVRGVCGADVLASHPCVVGKSMLFRRSELDALGGLALVENVLAEDYVLGKAFAEAGFRVALSAHILESVCSRRSVAEFCARHLRWSQMRRQLRPAVYLLEPLQSPIPFLLGSLALVGCGAAPGRALDWALALLLALLLRVFSDGALNAALVGAAPGLRDYIAIFCKDVLCLGIWAAGLFKTSVTWRGRRMRIGAESRLFPVGGSSTDVLEGA